MKKMFFLLVTLVLLIVACGDDQADGDQVGSDEEELENVTTSGMPIVNEPIELTFFTGKSVANVNSDWNDDFLVWSEYEDQSNIKVNFDEIHHEGLEEQRNLALTGGNLPDAFFLSHFPTMDIYRYGRQGTFVALNDLIDDYAPNLAQLMKDNPEIESAITFADGNIYSFPSIMSEDFLSVRLGARPWIHTGLLDELGMDIPETTDEFYDFLVAVKEHSGGDIVPYGGTGMLELVQVLSGSFGVMNQGPANGPVDLYPDTDDIRFYATTDEYRALLEYIHKLFDEELIEQNIFTIEWGQFLANASDGMYGSMIFYDPIDLFGEEVGSNFDSMSALQGPNGDQLFTKVASIVNSIGNMIITSENPHPEATMRWIDHFYSDEGSKLYYMGIEGVTYEETEDGIEYVDSILNPEDGITFEQELAKHLPWLGNTIGVLQQDFFRGSESAPMSLAASDKIEPYVPDIWSGFTYTDDEHQFLQSTGADIDQYVGEMRDNFIYGSTSFDDWDSYIDTLESMGLEEYLDIKQAAYDRSLE